MSAIAAFGIGALLITAEPSAWISTARNIISPDDPVLVVIVGSRERVGSVRAAVSRDRIVADTGDAFALVGRRVIAASAEAASGPINLLGWIDDPFDLVSVSSAGGRAWEQNRHSSKKGGRLNRSLSDEEREQAALIDSLVNKPTLTASEAGMLLRHMDSTGQF